MRHRCGLEVESIERRQIGAMRRRREQGRQKAILVGVAHQPFAIVGVFGHAMFGQRDRLNHDQGRGDAASLIQQHIIGVGGLTGSAGLG